MSALYDYLYTKGYYPRGWEGFFLLPSTRSILKRVSDVIQRDDNDARRDHGTLFSQFIRVSHMDVRVVILAPIPMGHDAKNMNEQGVMFVYSSYSPGMPTGDRVWKPFVMMFFTWLVENRKDVCIAIRDAKLSSPLSIELGTLKNNLLLAPGYMTQTEKYRQENLINGFFASRHLPIVTW